MSVEIVILGKNEEEKQSCKIMWEQNFNDLEGFVEFYFEHIFKENIVIGALKNNELVGMLHMNPYRCHFENKIYKTYYIVGVCVKEEYRRQGIMRSMMEKAISLMTKEGCPYTFLMPENTELYRTLGFENIYKNYKLHGSLDLVHMQEDDMSDVSLRNINNLDGFAVFVNNKLKKAYSTFMHRDKEYLNTMLKELESEQGDVRVVYSRGDDSLLGMYSYAVIDGVVFIERMLILDAEPLGFVAHIERRLKKMGNLEYEMTIQEDKISKIKQGLHNNQSLKMGKGIMALCLDKNLCSNEKIRNRSFFDEII